MIHKLEKNLDHFSLHNSILHMMEVREIMAKPKNLHVLIIWNAACEPAWLAEV
jgi:hypothetical protein